MENQVDKAKRILHYLSFLKWIFIVWIVVLIALAFRSHEDLLKLTGKIIFLSGIFMGLESLSDIEKMNEKERKLFTNVRFVKRQALLLLSSALILFVISMFFFSLPVFFPRMNPKLLDEFSTLGDDSMVMMLGLFCLLKTLLDKENFVRSLPAASKRQESSTPPTDV